MPQKQQSPKAAVFVSVCVILATALLTGKTMKPPRLLLLILPLVVLLGACQPAPQSATPTDPLDSVRTEVARTIEALTTAIVATDQAASTQTAVYFVPSPLPPTPEPSPLPPLSLPTEPAIPTAALQPSQTPAASCDLAAFVDETIPDGSQFPPGTTFTKTWTLRNAGSCTWTSDYAVVFSSGSAMGAPAVLPLTKDSIPPGATVTIAIPFTTPLTGGSYRADFKLRNASGVVFSFKNPSQTFWVEVQVTTGKIDFVAMACSAKWSSAAGELPCPGLPTDTRGFVYSDFAPVLENENKDNEPALWLGVQQIQNGTLKGIFPLMLIPENSTFSAVLGCAPDQKSCDVILRLSYQEGNNPQVELARWQKTHTSKLLSVKQDLSALAGRSVRLILELDANGSPAGDWVHLLAPVISP